MSFTVELTPGARRQLDRAMSWWRSERRAAPYLLDEELERMLGMLSEFPEIGRSLSNGRRSVVLAKTATTVVYRVRPKLRRIDVLKIQAARR